MKNLLVFSLAVLVTLFTSCSSDDDNNNDNNDNSLVGTWQLVSRSENGEQEVLSNCDKMVEVTFTNTTFTSTDFDQEDNGDCIEDGQEAGTYTTTGNQLTIIYSPDDEDTNVDNDEEDKSTGTFKIENNTLTTTFIDEYDGTTDTYISTFKRI